MKGIKDLTIQDLSCVEAYLSNSLFDTNVSVTWNGKQIVQIKDESFSLGELTKKILEISSSKEILQLPASERLPGLRILQIIKDLSRKAQPEFETRDRLSLSTRISLQWNVKYIENMIREAQEKFQSYDVDLFRQEYNPTDDDCVDESEKTVQASLYWIRKNAYEQLIVQPAKEQQKSPEVIKIIKEWCDNSLYRKAPALWFLWELLRLDYRNDPNTKEALTFIMGQIPNFTEKLCSKAAFLNVAGISWHMTEDQEDFVGQLNEALQTENSLLNTSLNQAKQCSQQKDFEGALKALKAAVEVIHQIEGWPCDPEFLSSTIDNGSLELVAGIEN